jgi:hypothetical protein
MGITVERGIPWLTRGRRRMIYDTDVEGCCVGEAAAARSWTQRKHQPEPPLQSSHLADGDPPPAK